MKPVSHEVIHIIIYLLCQSSRYHEHQFHGLPALDDRIDLHEKVEFFPGIKIDYNIYYDHSPG